ncbi:MAG: 5-bromo-4-chloroindolyl phosphate hydrolysis family protein [Cypionkella sp.]|nr:5-bromo-4-chloroindolyl phosphate hydrolysis family protein [Cypionkella sp.]
MAQRFRGKFSPAEQTGPARDVAATPRLRLMFIMPYLFLIAAFLNQSPDRLFMGLATFALMTASAWVTRDGLRAQAEFDARTMARPPKLPRKILGNILMGLGLALGAEMAGQSDFYIVLFAATGMILHGFAFGADPLRSKGMDGENQFQTDRVARAVEEGEAMLAAMAEAIAQTRDRALMLRVETFAHTARGLFRSIEDDPGDLTAARKYLTVYLMGARDATIKFASHYSKTREAAARTEYEALLRDLETTFASRTQALIGQGRVGLDIEIDVLRERLKLEN